MKMSDFQADLFREFGIESAENSENRELQEDKPPASVFSVKEKEVRAGFVPEFTVSEATTLFNQIFETATPSLKIVGEVANFKVNQGKWVFFDLKDAESSLGCFMTTFNLRVPIEDGMKVIINARPNITKWGKFSLTVRSVRPVGKGAIKRAFDLLREKLAKEGLFDEDRKRILPQMPTKIGVISSVDAAGFKDFAKIIKERFPAASLVVAHTQVQGEAAPEQICGALSWFNSSRNDVEVIAILRGGGSRDDLIAFDDELLVREIARSRIPIISGVGHEIDTTLADLAADVRASTPSNAAEILVPDKREIFTRIDNDFYEIFASLNRRFLEKNRDLQNGFREMNNKIIQLLQRKKQDFGLNFEKLISRNPAEILKRGYAILRTQDGKMLRSMPKVDSLIMTETEKYLIESEVKNVREK